MKTHRAAVCLAVAAFAAAAGWSRAESVDGLAGASVGAAALRQAFEKSWTGRPRQGPPRRLFETPKLFPVHPDAAGPLLASVDLASRLDAHRSLLTRQLGAQTWDISMASDASFQVKYLALSRAGTLVLKRIDDLNRLRGDGVVVQADAQTQYRVKVSINIFSPVRGSTVNLDPVNGTNGPSHKIKTGEVLDQVKGHSVVFRAGGQELWLLYGTDVDPKTDRLAATRSLLFVHEAGLDSKAWPVPEAQLAVDQAVAVDLADVKLLLVRSADGTLRVHGR